MPALRVQIPQVSSKVFKMKDLQLSSALKKDGGMDIFKQMTAGLF